MLTKPPPISWWESNSASLHQTQGASLEQAIVSWWRDVLRVPQHYSADRMPQSGATETAPWESSPPTVVLDALLGHAAAMSIGIELHRATAVARDERPASDASNVGVRKRKQLEQQHERQLAFFDGYAP